MSSGKSVQEYRRDIFALKGRLKGQEEHLAELKQKYSDLQVNGEQSYTFSMKMKILEYTLNDIRSKLAKFAKEEAYEYYQLNYAVFALMKSCEVMGMSKEMIFRGVDINGEGKVSWFDFNNFLREVMRLDSEFTGPIMKVLYPDEKEPLTKERYHHFLTVFMLSSEQNGEMADNLDEPVDRIGGQIIKQKVNQESIWSQKELNIATTVYGLMRALKYVDVLDCVACYCKCDPLKSGAINTSTMVALLSQKVRDSTTFGIGGKLKRFKLDKK